MRVFFKFFSLTLMCAFTAGIVNAHTLHVGNKSFPLFQTKYSSPSLAFGIGNETWYAPMTRIFINNSLHLKVDSITYSVINCDEGFTDTENYTYDENGRLIGADERLWVRGKNSAYIDTEFVATGHTRIKTKYYNTTSNAKWFFGTRQSRNKNAFALQCASSTSNVRNDYGTAQNPPTIAGAKCGTLGIFIADKNKNVTTLQHPNGQTYTGTVSGGVKSFSTQHNLLILASYIDAILHSNTNKFYYFKVWSNGADENTLVRDMVPVPACMRIGDFIVPENGMWDIVEQKFYGNANSTGTIIYGRDE